MYLGQFRLSTLWTFFLKLQSVFVYILYVFAIGIFSVKIFLNCKKAEKKKLLSRTTTFRGHAWSGWDQFRIKLMKCSKLLLPISAALVCFCGVQRLILLASPTCLLSKFSVLMKNVKKWWLLLVIFSVFYYRSCCIKT